MLTNARKRKRFLLNESSLNFIESNSKKFKVSKNFFLEICLKEALKQYAKENLFFNAEILDKTKKGELDLN